MSAATDHSITLLTTPTAVYIAEPEVAAPAAEESNRRRFSAGLAKRLTGRPAGGPGPSSLQSALSQTSLEALSVSNSASSLTQTHDDSGRQRRRSEHIGERLLAQVAEWLEHEKKKKEARAHAKRHHPHHQGNQHHHVAQRQLHRQHEHRSEPETPESPGPNPDMDTLKAKHRASSIDSDSSGESLDRLQRILDDTAASLGLSAIPKLSPRLGPSLSRRHRKPSVRSLQAHRSISSDTDYVDGDVVVPGCDVVLDNSKTVNYSESKARQEDKSSSLSPGKRGGGRERRAWLQFKNDIIRLAHTLKLKGWRQVPLEGGDLISVQRLSGALTNAVYVVTPPSEADLPPPPSSTTTPTTTGVSESSDPAGSGARTPRQQRPRRPEKLLLRIYGPQVEHLIDRDSELSVLRRLARKKIGPRMLGTFRNGRFEQFFDATTLTPADLREPETSCHIAKRMRELHDGVEILPEEEAEGPGVWKNWDRWVGKAEQIMRVLDTQILSGSQGAVTRGTVDAWKTRGLVCGVEWSQFKDAVAKVRRFIDDYYGDPQTLRERLVFAHNDVGS